jgi:hypothetical protein
MKNKKSRHNQGKKFTDDGMEYYLAKGEPVVVQSINLGEGVGKALEILKAGGHQVRRGQYADGTVYWRVDGKVLQAHELTKLAGMWK